MSLLSVSSISNPSAPQANISLNADGSVTLPVYTGSSAPLLFQAGTLWYNTTGPALQIRNPANTSWVSLTPPVAATLAEAAAGTLNTVYSSPLTSVPKDASGMTGAALLPTGTNAQRTAIATPVAGMTRFNTDYTPDSLEVYNGTNWRQVAYVPNPTLPADLTISANTTLTNSTYVVNNLTIAAGATATLSSQSVVFICYGDVNIAGTINGSGSGPTGGFAAASGGTSVTPVIGVNIGSKTPGVALGAALPYQPLTSSTGSGGTSGQVFSGAGGLGFSSGGNGGAGILIRTLKNATITGSLLSTGTAASTPVANAPVGVTGGGGGSGGAVVVHAAGLINFSGVIDVSGGAGAAGVINGVGVGMNGGGGGGGGYVILEADSGLTNTGTITLTGGAAGATAGTVDANGGGNGGSYGGKGGQHYQGPGPTAGSAGVFATAGSPI
jgi:hypothetical protein